MNKIRINVLARELEVKAHELLDKLPELGVTEKKTHSSSIDDDVAEKLRRDLRWQCPAAAGASRTGQFERLARPSGSGRAERRCGPDSRLPGAEVAKLCGSLSPVREAPARGSHATAQSLPQPAAAASSAARRPSPAVARRRPLHKGRAPARRARRAPGMPIAAPVRHRRRSRLPQPRARDRCSPDRGSHFPAGYRPAEPVRVAADPALAPAQPHRCAPASRRRQPGTVRLLCGRMRHGRAWRVSPRCVPWFRRGRISPLNFPSLGPGARAPRYRRARGFQCAAEFAGSRPTDLSRTHSARAADRCRARARGRELPGACARAVRVPCIRHRAGVWWRPVWRLRQSSSSAGRRDKRGARSQRDRQQEQEEKVLRPVRREAPSGPPPVNREITISEGITVKELSEKLDVKASLVIKKLVDRNIFATINQTLDSKLATELAREFGASTATVSFEEEAMHEVETAQVEKDQVKRAPGSDDHGPRGSRQNVTA